MAAHATSLSSIPLFSPSVATTPSSLHDIAVALGSHALSSGSAGIISPLSLATTKSPLLLSSALPPEDHGQGVSRAIRRFQGVVG